MIMRMFFKKIWTFIYSIFNFYFYRSSKIFNNELLRDTNSNINLNINDNYVPQGICSIDDYLLVTMYDSNHELNSKVCIIKNGRIIHTTMLDNKAHVGGICYDSINDNIWITDRSGTISCYEYNHILNSNNVSAKYKKVKIPGLINIAGFNAVGYITYYSNRLYMGNFNIGKSSKMLSYELNEEGNINFDSRNEIDFFSFVQGITFKEYDSKTLMFISSSYGINKSSIRIVDYETKKVLHKVKMPPMLEQITFDKFGNLVLLFESNAKMYKKYKFKNNDINIIKINKL